MKNNTMNIEINNNYHNIEELTFPASNNMYPQHLTFRLTPEGDFEYNLAEPIYVDVPKKYNIYTYNSTDFGYNLQTQKIMNLLAHGHYIILTYNDKEYPLAVPSRKFIDTMILDQIAYLLITKGYSRLTDTFLQNYLALTFATVKDAKEYLQSDEFITEVRLAERYITLNNSIRDVLLDIEQDKATQRELLQDSWKQAQLQDFYTTELKPMLPATLQDPAKLAGIPNQEVTAPVRDRINYQVGFAAEQLGTKKEFTSSYIKAYDKTITATVDQLEAQLVNAWYYANPEYHVPSRDELVDELEQLQSEYEDLRFNCIAKNLTAKEVKQLVADFTPKYIRMLELQEKLGTEPNGKLNQ